MKLAILGAGIAGLSSAIALRHQGFDVELFERRSETSAEGGGLVLWPNATFVLHQLGMLSDTMRLGGQPPGMQRLSRNGDDLGRIDIQLINQHMNYPSVSVLREDLLQLLLGRAQSSGIPIHAGKTVTHISDEDDRRTCVHFDDGDATSADIVIGADGRMASAARAYVQGDNQPVFQGFLNWVGVFESRHKVFNDLSIRDYWGVGERFGVVPIDAYRAYWAGGTACSHITDNHPENYRQELYARFTDWPSPVPTLIQLTPRQRIHKIYVHDHDPLNRWHRNNVILIGDAAHASLPTSGQGACQALEDSWHLSRYLATQTDNLQQAFENFTRTRAEKTRNIIVAGRQLATSLFNTDEAACASRDRASRDSNFKELAWAMAKGWGRDLPMRNQSI